MTGFEDDAEELGREEKRLKARKPSKKHDSSKDEVNRLVLIIMIRHAAS